MAETTLPAETKSEYQAISKRLAEAQAAMDSLLSKFDPFQQKELSQKDFDFVKNQLIAQDVVLDAAIGVMNERASILSEASSLVDDAQEKIANRIESDKKFNELVRKANEKTEAALESGDEGSADIWALRALDLSEQALDNVAETQKLNDRLKRINAIIRAERPFFKLVLSQAHKLHETSKTVAGSMLQPIGDIIKDAAEREAQLSKFDRLLDSLSDTTVAIGKILLVVAAAFVGYAILRGIFTKKKK